LPGVITDNYLTVKPSATSDKSFLFIAYLMALTAAAFSYLYFVDYQTILRFALGTARIINTLPH